MSIARTLPSFEQLPLVTVGLMAMLVVLFAGYIYFLSASIVHVVMRSEINSEIAELNSTIADLEAEYISRQHAVSEEIATQKGFVAAADKIFLKRGDTSVVLGNTR